MGLVNVEDAADSPSERASSTPMGLFERLLLHSTAIARVRVDPEGIVAEINDAFERQIRRPREEVVGSPLSTLLVASEEERFQAWLGGDASPPESPVRVNFVAAGGAPFTLLCLLDPTPDGLTLLGEMEIEGNRPITEELMRLNNELATMARERGRRQRELERTQRRLEATLEELRTSYWHLQKIQEVMPLCMACGKVKGDGTQWQTVAEYLKANEIFLSHGYCPSCADAFLREHELEEG